MASFSKMARTTIPLQAYTKFSMNMLGSRLYCCCQTPCGGDYDSRKYGHKLSSNLTQPCFDTLKNIPTGVFRNTEGEILGLGAGKCCCYKNPEYFSYHHMSYYDLNMGLRQYRKPSPDTKRKPTHG